MQLAGETPHGSSLPLEARFMPHKDDYIQAIREFYRPRLSQRNAAIWFLCILALSVGSVMVSGTGYVWPVIAVLSATLLILGAQLFLMPALMARQVNQDERLRAETTWTITDERIRIASRLSDSSLDWSMFAYYIETESLFLLAYATNKNLCQILPKRAFQTQDQQQRFRTLLSQKLAPKP